MFGASLLFNYLKIRQDWITTYKNSEQSYVVQNQKEKASLEVQDETVDIQRGISVSFWIFRSGSLTVCTPYYFSNKCIYNDN